MSDHERSGSSSDEEDDIETSGLIATRQKRATAGNLYATLRANLDDEELQKELLAEDEEEDAGDYEGSDKDADDDILESSSEDEDAGPPKEGEVEDLDGEKALKRQERVEAKKKRRVNEARLKIPSWHKKKRVKLADDVKTEDGSTSERPRKKSERSNWLPSVADAPTRQSGRASAVANREIVHANLKQSAERSERQRRVMKDAAERDRGRKWMLEMTQEERMKKCEKIERETAKEFGRWERDEAERQRLRDEALAAKRKRGIDGPAIRHWSGSVMWEGDRIKVRRMSHGSRKLDEVKDEKKMGGDEEMRDAVEPDGGAFKEENATQEPETSGTSAVDGSRQAELVQANAPIPVPSTSHPPVPPIPVAAPQTQAPGGWLQGIHEYAAQPEIASTQPMNTSYIPSAPAINGYPPTQPQPSPAYAQPCYQPPPMYHGWPPGSNQFALHPLATQPVPPPPPTPPLIREQAQRSLIMLESFDTLDLTITKRTPKYKQIDTALETDPVKTILLPSAHPSSFSSEEQKYLTAKMRKRQNEIPLPPAPTKARCVLTPWPAKFRDPKTGLPYSGMHEYKAIQRLLAGGCQWSALLGCWVGPDLGALMGRPAKGVPEGFAGVPVKKETETVT